MRDTIETAEISDAELDNVSGGLGASLPGGLASIDVTPGPGGLAASVNGPGLSGGLNAGVPAVEGANGIVG